jgi:hypothetical protein
MGLIVWMESSKRNLLRATCKLPPIVREALTVWLDQTHHLVLALAPADISVPKERMSLFQPILVSMLKVHLISGTLYVRRVLLQLNVDSINVQLVQLVVNASVMAELLLLSVLKATIAQLMMVFIACPVPRVPTLEHLEVSAKVPVLIVRRAVCANLKQ